MQFNKWHKLTQITETFLKAQHLTLPSSLHTTNNTDPVLLKDTIYKLFRHVHYSADHNFKKINMWICWFSMLHTSYINDSAQPLFTVSHNSFKLINHWHWFHLFTLILVTAAGDDTCPLPWCRCWCCFSLVLIVRYHLYVLISSIWPVISHISMLLHFAEAN